MESTSSVHGLSLRKTPRKGQSAVLKKIASDPDMATLNVQLPTGYGKTFAAALAYSYLKSIGKVNRMLYIVPTRAQLEQFVMDGKGDLKDAGVSGPKNVCDINYSPVVAIRQNRNDKTQVFATTVQALTNHGKTTWDLCAELMHQGLWMVVIDEYHHYGIDAHWGRETAKLKYNFRLTMSATPHRMNNDSAFGKPDIITTYREAVEEKAVKPLECHSYIYRIDAIMKDGEVKTYTTSELVEEAGYDSPEAIEKMKIKRSMRWSPKYVSPLVETPISRMVQDRLSTGYPLQVLVGAMCCSAAEMTYEQIKVTHPELRVDWVGTGPNGRDNQINAEVLRKFCPPKKNGERPWPELDVLVHVGMAGEGLDSVYVSEVVHLNSAMINNSNNQENGRAARYLEGVAGYINVDSCSPYAEFTGQKVMDVMDDIDAIPDDEDIKEKENSELEYEPSPEEPKIRIWDMECIEIDEGEKMKMAQAILNEGINGWDKSVLEDPDHEIFTAAILGVKRMRREEAEKFNEKSMVSQWDHSVESLLSKIVGLCVRKATNGKRFEKSMPGDFKKRINSRKKQVLGKKVLMVENLKKHYAWLIDLEKHLLKNEVPSWLQ